MNQHTPALIIGAGPTGLTLAHELHRHNIPFRILDKRTHPTSTSNALAIQTRTVEMLANMGILDSFVEHGMKIKGLRMNAGRECLTTLDTQYLPSPYHYILGVPQSETEKILTNKLEQQNHFIERDKMLASLEQDAEKVTVECHTLDDRIETFTCDWLLACDGAHSSVRELIHMPFLGRDIAEHFILADVTVETALDLDYAQVFFSERGLFAVFPLPNRVYRFVASVKEAHDPLTPISLDELQSIADARTDHQLKIVDVLWTSAFHIHSKMTEHMRDGRVFLLGDAAHIHSPAGGQGMNTGMQDAYNLAWKLALVHRGQAKPTLLDSYEEERRPIAAGVLSDTERLTRLALIKNPVLNTLRRLCVRWLLGRSSINRRFITHITQLSLRYRNSSIIEYQTAANHGGPLPGEKAPDLIFTKGSETHTLAEYLNRPVHHLLVFTGSQKKDENQKEIFHKINQLKKRFTNLLDIVWIVTTANNDLDINVNCIVDSQHVLYDAFHARKPCIYLLRPDQTIGFSAQLSEAHRISTHLEFYLCP